ncbi:uncharacterized protein MKZ38_000911 [Zalerion maritima]|uniref:Amino acid permease/ SLC12A domain-containing protein n=1 Tax=Zalerion maritima TaxID=339359 RepID=A0AAD5RF25_9PEZI|nr:uncharacterized protein MKZ38_000911 [Zalerion maritima]
MDSPATGERTATPINSASIRTNPNADMEKMVNDTRAEEMSMSSDTPRTELRQTLKEHHVNMIGFSIVLGVGLFLSSGKIIFMTGPGMAVLAYILMGTLMWSVAASLAEMTALFPVKGPVFEFARRFVDEAVGMAAAWMLWFAWTIVLIAELLAITEIFKFRVNPEYLREVEYPEESVEWPAGLTTSPAVWVGLFLFISLLTNFLPVRQFGQIQYVMGCLKIVFIVVLIVVNVVVNARQRFHDRRFWTYEQPWGFAAQNFTVRGATGTEDEVVFEGNSGRFVAFWTAMTSTFFSLLGWDAILITAPENKDVQLDETLKLSTRKMSLRIMILYPLSVFAAGLNVAYDDSQLRDLTINGVGGGQGSPFVIAAVREHIKVLPHVMNAFFIFSAASTAMATLYIGSRLLHAIASLPNAWPQWGWAESIRSRLERTRFGVPMNAMVLTWIIGFLGFLSVSSDTTQTLGRVITSAVVFILIVYAVNCWAFLNFFKEINSIAAGDRDDELNITPEMRSQYKRNARQYPYRSHLQWLRAGYGLVFCILLILFNGWRSFVNPFSVDDFIASYIAIPIFLALTAAYYVKTRGFKLNVRAARLNGLEAIGPVVVPDPKTRPACDTCGLRHRRGRIPDMPAGRFTKKQAAYALLEWVWVWMK